MQEHDHRETLRSFYDEHKRMPSYSEMLKLFGYKSKNAVYRLVQKMLDAGMVTKDALGRLIPSDGLLGGVKLLGLVEAGFATPAEEQLLDTVSLDELLVKKPESTFLLRVKGESMIDAGIREGDMVLAERTQHAKVGDIVIAEVDGGWTMKYLRKEKDGRMYLEPANERFANIYPSESLTIAAVVKAVIRTY